MEKKTILMLPTWYPSTDNPFNGCFFREQAIAMTKNYNFIVATYKAKSELALIYYLKKILKLNNPKVNFVKTDNGLEEYSIYVNKPQFLFWDLLISRFVLIIKHTPCRQGVGKIEHHSLVNQRRFVVEYIYRKKLLPHFDCVYSLTSQDFAPLGKTFSDVFKVPHVTAEHAPFPWPGHVLTDSAVNAIEEANAFLAISNDKIRQVFLQDVHVNPIWVGNMCDENAFSLCITKHKVPVFLIVAANNFYKNYPLFIKTMEELKRISNEDFKIVIAGYNSNKGYSQNAKSLENLVHNSIINENTEMIEAVSREFMPKLYNSCDVFVMTSIQEGLPVSAIEASMSGLPVFSTRCGGVEDYIDNSMGRIFSITDYQGMANACNEYLKGHIKFNNSEIREKAISLFGKEAFVKRMKVVFDGVMSDDKSN